jgi:amino-acid N-acetyltransferase
MGEQIYRRASLHDLPAIMELLSRSNLPLDGVEEIAERFLVALRGEELVGCAALEPYGADALLRSVAVRESERRLGVGQEMVRILLDQARDEGIRSVVLLTTTAAEFFPRFGFRRINRNDAPAPVWSSVEFRSACPESATVMLLDIGEHHNAECEVKS